MYYICLNPQRRYARHNRESTGVADRGWMAGVNTQTVLGLRVFLQILFFPVDLVVRMTQETHSRRVVTMKPLRTTFIIVSLVLVHSGMEASADQYRRPAPRSSLSLIHISEPTRPY